MTQHTLGDAPIEEAHRRRMNEIARILDQFFNGSEMAPETYLGDGLSVSINDGVIRLRASGGFEKDQVVYLAAKTLEAFMMWLIELRRGLHAGA
jgi:hypothetical protein